MKKIISCLHKFFAKSKISCVSNNQKAQLMTNTAYLMNVMRFLEKHWNVVVCVNFPTIFEDFDEEFAESSLTTELRSMIRSVKRKRSKGCVSSVLVYAGTYCPYHCSVLFIGL
jgi:hypothetical protein